ncbi:hypothetical protein [Nocardioides sp. B-3]|uniref:hypothetical protein n=1 Tax=Nocardioides sp. B-3 TaxID=2895565 RepID=UPI002152756F|nr:hypothetical protein [Nocardioides sp. B-3]UUZ58860.1 hypothetical protein LP418_22750 [Nocardioides sp. B-3]
MSDKPSLSVSALVGLDRVLPMVSVPPSPGHEDDLLDPIALDLAAVAMAVPVRVLDEGVGGDPDLVRGLLPADLRNAP